MELKFDDLEAKQGFFVTTKPETPTFLPEPERRKRHYTLVSVDDHLVEPPHLFEGRMPAQYADLAPRVELDEQGMEYWLYDGKRQYKVGLNAVSVQTVGDLSRDFGRESGEPCGKLRCPAVRQFHRRQTDGVRQEPAEGDQGEKEGGPAEEPETRSRRGVAVPPVVACFSCDARIDVRGADHAPQEEYRPSRRNCASTGKSSPRGSG